MRRVNNSVGQSPEYEILFIEGKKKRVVDTIIQSYMEPYRNPYIKDKDKAEKWKKQHGAMLAALPRRNGLLVWKSIATNCIGLTKKDVFRKAAVTLMGE